jgi:hypothetical protein
MKIYTTRKAIPVQDKPNQAVTCALQIKSDLKAGGTHVNHSQTMRGLKVKSQIKAGGIHVNHSQAATCALKIKSDIKAGALGPNHNQTVARRPRL